MPHSHPPGWSPVSVPELYVFAGSVFAGGDPLARIVEQPRGREVRLRFESSRPVAAALVLYLTEPLRYGPGSKIAVRWNRLDAALDASARTVSASLPPEAVLYYVNLTDDRGCVVSSNLIQLAP